MNPLPPPDAPALYARALWEAGVDLAWLEDASAGVCVVGTGERVSVGEWEAAMASLPAGAAASEPGLGWVGFIDFAWMLGRLGLGAVNEPATSFLRVRGALRFEAGEARWVQEVAPGGTASARHDDALPGREADLASQRAAAEAVLRAALEAAPTGREGGVGPSDPAEASRVPLAPVWRGDGESYARAVREILARIADGDAYVVCLTTAVDVPGAFDGLETFLALRAAHPTHHLGLIRIGELCLVAASPELFLRVDGDGTATTVPIKGTRPRGATREEDARLALALAADPKELAENLMVVDVARNDLSRVCEPGSVAVPRFREVESYAGVHQLVSEVRGRLRPGVSVLEVLASLAPGTSMTGAPKRRAAQIAASLEPGGRGVYSGAFGWIGSGGGLDLAMSIRCAVITPERAMIGVGGGITADSVPAAEWAEAQLKARATLAALRR
ncbi:anthranilate synthase component I family protein [Galactobacter valiniphilus]|uniref:anthranilate synthase component I family protein n=1 Tax=Galactobacter valiniphilus TaxID=2676122 RepID=UPI003734CA06